MKPQRELHSKLALQMTNFLAESIIISKDQLEFDYNN